MVVLFAPQNMTHKQQCSAMLLRQKSYFGPFHVKTIKLHLQLAKKEQQPD
jgi:hypothetical protein